MGCESEEQHACKTDKDCMGCKGQYCQAFSDDQSFCASCSELKESDCAAVDSCIYNAKAKACMQGFGKFDTFKSACGMQESEESCKGCGGKFKKGACSVTSMKSAKKVKCKKLSADFCTMVPGCTTKKDKCAGKAFK